MLRGTCRYCKKPISMLYPFIELLTALLLSLLLVRTPIAYFPAYFIFFSALIITIRSDLESMLISRFTTIFLIPCALVLSWLGLLPITLFDSVLGAVCGYLFLYTVAKLFLLITGKTGIGQGDFDLLSFIGSFVGLIGCWATLLIGSVLGSIIGITYMLLIKPQQSVRIPFGPFLAFGAVAFVLFRTTIWHILLGL